MSPRPHFDGWPRRLVVWIGVAVATPMLVILSPILFAVALGADLLTAPTRLRLVRLLGMSLNYLLLTMAGLLAAFVLWVLTGGGIAMRTRWSQRAHHRVQLAWTRGLLRAVQRWLGAVVRIEGGDLVAPGPIVILARHTSFFDAVVPTVVLGDHSAMVPRHILKQELTWEPCLDLYGRRLPNHFVDRDATQSRQDRDAIAALAGGLGSDAAVIFPEGTFPSARRAAQVRERFAQREPERAALLSLRHVLPPRPGGLSALLDGAPRADVVILGHRGFEPFGSFRAIAAHVPFREPVDVKLWRIPRSEIPTDPTARLASIDEWWQRLDDWIDRRPSPGDPRV